jgi:C1A family cysteine protease
MFVKNNNGIQSSSKYLYKAIDTDRCSYNGSQSVTSVSDYLVLPPGDESLIQTVLVAVGPLSCAVDASLFTFQNYNTGIYDDPTCSKNINHAMLIVGYGTENGIDYWILKNSYGVLWGEKGYMRIRRGVNMCGIANYVSLALI